MAGGPEPFSNFAREPKTIEPLILRPSKWKAIGLLLICTIFALLGIRMGLSGEWIGYLCAAFFGLGVPVSILQFLPGASFLRIDAEGLTTRTMFRESHVPWNIVDQFFVVGMKQSGLTVHRMVGFNYRPEYDQRRTSRQIAETISGCEGGLPDTYGMKAEDLAALLNECLLRYQEGLLESEFDDPS